MRVTRESIIFLKQLLLRSDIASFYKQVAKSINRRYIWLKIDTKDSLAAPFNGAKRFSKFKIFFFLS